MRLFSHKFTPSFISSSLAFLSTAFFFCGSFNAFAACDSLAQTAILTSALKQHYAIDGTFELTATKSLADLPETPTSVELVDVPETLSSNITVRARYFKDNQVLSEITATFRAQWRVKAFVARAQVNKGNINLADFDIQTVDRLSLRLPPVAANANLTDYEIINPITPGTVLTWGVLRSQPLVHKGTIVDVVAEEGNLKITTRAVALQDGGRGETVVLRNTSTNRPFEAYVVNENTVQIRF